MILRSFGWKTFLSFCHECCFCLAGGKRGWVNLKREYVCLIWAVIPRPLLVSTIIFGEVSVDGGVFLMSCTSSTWACRALTCSWTWTTSPPELFLLLCFTDKVIFYQYLSLWFLQSMFLFNPFKWSFQTQLYCMFRGGLGPVHVAIQNRNWRF